MKLDEVRRDGKSKGTSDDGDVRRLFQSGYGVSCDPSENTFFPGSDDIAWYLQCFATVTANLRLETQ